jgi:hypothetical protein
VLLRFSKNAFLFIGESFLRKIYTFAKNSRAFVGETNNENENEKFETDSRRNGRKNRIQRSGKPEGHRGAVMRQYVRPPVRNSLVDAGYWTGPGSTTGDPHGPPGATLYWDYVAYNRPPVALPAAFRPIAELLIWLVWEQTSRISQDGTEVSAKEPRSVRHYGTRGYDMSGCGTLEQAMHEYRTNDRWAGLGMRLDGQQHLVVIDVDLKHIAADDPDRVLIEAMSAKYGLHAHYSVTEHGGGFHVVGYISPADAELAGLISGTRIKLWPLGERPGFIDVFHTDRFVTITHRTKIDGPLGNIGSFVREVFAVNDTRTPLPIRPDQNFGLWDQFRGTDARTPQQVIEQFAKHANVDKLRALFNNDIPKIVELTKETGSADYPYRRFKAWMSLCSIFTSAALPSSVVVADPDLLLRILKGSQMTANGKHEDYSKRTYASKLDRFLSEYVVAPCLNRDMPKILAKRQREKEMRAHGEKMFEAMRHG